MKQSRGFPPLPPLPEAERAVEVIEKDTETSWAMFQAIQNQQERGFEKTKPGGLGATTAGKLPGGPVSLDEVLVEVRRDNRVCPLPTAWLRLHALLPNKPDNLPPVPATREEWARMPSLQKRARLRAHLEWAAAQGVLPQVHQVLVAMPEAKWHHMGD